MILCVGLIDHVSSIDCYTCSLSGFYCPLPLYLDAGDESNENPVGVSSYDIGYACQVQIESKRKRRFSFIYLE